MCHSDPFGNQERAQFQNLFRMGREASWLAVSAEDQRPLRSTTPF